MKRYVNVQLTHAEAEALAEACAFREAGNTDDLTYHQYMALMRGFRKLQDARSA